MAETITLDSQVHEILAQIFIAFGQGAGTMTVSREAIRAATRTYTSLVQANVTKWRDIELQTLEYARSLGRVAAHLALRDGSQVVRDEHYREASERFAAAATELEYDCPFCPGTMLKR